MSETEAFGQDEAGIQAAPAVAQPSAGSLLRAARENAGMDLQELAVTLKVPARKIEALEADQLDELPDAMFVRALASSICRALRVDPAPILERLPQSGHQPFEKTNTGLNTPFRATRVRSASSMPWLGHLLRPGPLVAIALLLGALALLLVPSLPTVDSLMSKNQPPTPVMPPGGLTVDVADTAARAAPEAPQTASVAPSLRPAPGASLAVPALTATSALKAPGNDLLAFTVNAATWVEVADAKGKMPLRRVLNAGEKVNVEGSLPMRVIVGRADAVRVDVRGQPLDITALAKDNVARFEVK